MRFAYAALIAIVTIAGCRCRSEQVTADEPKKAKSAPHDTESVKVCIEGVRGLSKYNARCEHSEPWWGSVDRAVEQLRPACERLAVAPGARFERKEVEACNAALEKAACFAPLPAECRIGGALAEGELCAFTVQCGVAHVCEPTDPKSYCGKCVKVAQEGESCDRPCDEGLVCLGGKCGKPLGTGAACQGPGECQRSLLCGPARTCIAPHKEGEACSGLDCEVTLRCVDGKCKPRERPNGPGAPCKDGLDCLDYACVDGHCAAPLRAGESCGMETAPCSPSLMCVEGKCVLPDARNCH